MSKKKYYLPIDGEDYDRWYGRESVVCLDKKELNRMIAEYSMHERDSEGRLPSKASLLRCWRECTKKEIEEYGVFDS